MEERVKLVDLTGQMVGTMDKMEAHLLGELHAAFSVFIFNSKGELLLQQRATGKYHSGGKWTNTCCSHPRLGEKSLEAAHRRLYEEMGMQCELHFAFNFTYRAELDNGLIEYEYDDVYFGVSDQLPVPAPGEVKDFKYIALPNLELELIAYPDKYTVWLKICLGQVLAYYKGNKF